MGIEPGGTRTRSATARPCEFDIAEVTSLLMTPNLCITSSSAALLEFDDGDKLLRALVRNRYRRAAAPRDLLDRCFDVVRRVVTPVHDQKIFDAAKDGLGNAP
jgi:hypothetical protein